MLQWCIECRISSAFLAVLTTRQVITKSDIFKNSNIKSISNKMHVKFEIKFTVSLTYSSYFFTYTIALKFQHLAELWFWIHPVFVTIWLVIFCLFWNKISKMQARIFIFRLQPHNNPAKFTARSKKTNIYLEVLTHIFGLKFNIWLCLLKKSKCFM